MGGHGGLNILPQKKWNVYNYDNRAIVEKDKKEYEQKLRNKYEKNRKQQLQNKIQVLALQQNNQINNNKISSVLANQLRKIQEQHQHINLFKEEQKIIENKQLEEAKRLRETQLFKQQNVDYSSKFLGTYANEKQIPWYIKNKSKTNKKISKCEEIIKQNIKQQNQSKSKQIERQRSARKHKEQIETDKMTTMQKLKMERLKRQAKEHKRAQKLKLYLQKQN